MLIVGCDYHPRWQQVAWLDTETGESGEQKLVNGDGEAERWYRQLPPPSLIGLEATGNSQWFIDLLNQLGHEVWVGDGAEVRASCVREHRSVATTRGPACSPRPGPRATRSCCPSWITTCCMGGPICTSRT